MGRAASQQQHLDALAGRQLALARPRPARARPRRASTSACASPARRSGARAARRRRASAARAPPARAAGCARPPRPASRWRAGPRGRRPERGERGAHEELEGDHRRDRVAGQAEDEHVLARAEPGRLAGAQRHSPEALLDAELARARPSRGRADPTDTPPETITTSAPAERLARAPRASLRAVAEPWRAHELRARRGDLARQRERRSSCRSGPVRAARRAARARRPSRAAPPAAGARTASSARPTEAATPSSAGPSGVPRAQHHVARAQVLARAPDVRARGGLLALAPARRSRSCARPGSRRRAVAAPRRRSRCAPPCPPPARARAGGPARDSPATSSRRAGPATRRSRPWPTSRRAARRSRSSRPRRAPARAPSASATALRRERRAPPRARALRPSSIEISTARSSHRGQAGPLRDAVSAGVGSSEPPGTRRCKA